MIFSILLNQRFRLIIYYLQYFSQISLNKQSYEKTRVFMILQKLKKRRKNEFLLKSNINFIVI